MNYECCERFIKENNKKYETADFIYNGKKETYNICEGMPVLATQNIKDIEIYNTMKFTIEEITNNIFTVYNETFSKSEFAQNFIPAFSVTVYKYQGCDIGENYNIHDVNRMDKNSCIQHYREPKKLEYIHYNNKELNNQYCLRKAPVLELCNCRFNSLYKNGKIYKVTFNNS